MTGTGDDGTSTNAKPHGQHRLTKGDTIVGALILITAQAAAASTATCVKGLPAETPSILRGLWRQTLTSFIFSVMTLGLFVWNKKKMMKKGDGGVGQSQSQEQKKSEKDDEKKRLLSNSNGSSGAENGNNGGKEEPLLPETESHHQEEKEQDGGSTAATARATARRMALIVMAVCGAAVQNDAIVIALRYASSAAVMCLCNTTPVWLILYAVLSCNQETPGAITILGAAISIVGAIVCATDNSSSADGGDDADAAQQQQHSAAGLGAVIATTAGIGAAFYMTACRKLAPVGLHPIHLTLMINIGMSVVSYLLCVLTLEGGLTILSRSTTDGFFGFLNPEANPAAFFHSVFPDCLGNFGIMLALGYFEPLIVSMVMLTEPLNASIIATNVVGEAPPSARTVIGVSIVLVGCAVVLVESSREGRDAAEIESEDEVRPSLEPERRRSVARTRRTSQVVLLSPIGTIAPDATAKAAFRKLTTGVARRSTLPVSLIREMSMNTRQRSENLELGVGVGGAHSEERRLTLPSSILRNLQSSLKRLSFTRGAHSESSLGGGGSSASSRRRSSRWGSFFRYGSIISEGEEDDEGGRERESRGRLPRANEAAEQNPPTGRKV